MLSQPGASSIRSPSREPLDQGLDGQHERVAVAIEPQRDAGHGDLDAVALGQMARDPGDQVGGMDLGHRPASAGQGAALLGEALEGRAQVRAVVPDRPRQGALRVGREVGLAGQRLGGLLQLAERRA